MTPPRVTSAVTLPPGSGEPPDRQLLKTLVSLERQVDSLRREFALHVANETRWHAEVYSGGDLAAHRREHELIAQDRQAQGAALQALVDGQRQILAELHDVRKTQAAHSAEIQQNTDITSTLANAGRTVSTLRRWLLWVGPPIILVLGIAVGVWQFQAARGGISP